jgi:UDP-N-acetylglucosamine--N-acetylmuramyl-(pentapeptide) pyrophosphoryl-undecaprenol N-acetylglucosamine transferase
MNILFAGGGSLGPVTPLLATAKALKRRDSSMRFFWAGTPDGPERALVEAEGIEFHPVPVAKLPRYPDWRWLTFPYDMLNASGVARDVLRRTKPDAVVSVGGFTSVPVIRAAAKAGIPCFIHQLDANISWSNAAVAHLCVSKTSSFKREGYDLIPTPTRFSSPLSPPQDEEGKRRGGARPTVLIMGGGQGAKALNEALLEKLDRWLEKVDVIHVAGKGKTDSKQAAGYLAHELLDANGMMQAYASADVVVTRAGIGALSEIAALKKASIIVPIPGSHQEENALAFDDANAGVYVRQDQDDFSDILFQQTMEVISNPRWARGRMLFFRRMMGVRSPIESLKKPNDHVRCSRDARRRLRSVSAICSRVFATKDTSDMLSKTTSMCFRSEA